ncbi:hypothetical protein EV580_6608 [Mycobacterium sp. BK086]|uniref:hypothetical protein n=1 Tax=Mycobacterium sp. BK086 TaxID=2512165 RepID=UPI00105BE3D2|nr:hypothetical protein [Mycobacterium sp. BK086]TDO06516.1 hypothetical protein EV580_6608 [Mycobacterium sp. BK086]
MPSKPSAKARAWPLFDAIVDRAERKDVNPWASDGTAYEPDFDTLETLLAVPLHLAATTQSGVPALAFDVWVAYELRRAGLDPDAVWPRASPPRVVDRDVILFVERMPKKIKDELWDRLRKSTGVKGVTAASANIAGKNYLKQVDVIMSHWQTGPEILISGKRMDSSFGKNAANRVEESYGDAKNLALRHPLSALGFVFGLRSTCYTEEPRIFDWIVDLLSKLSREDGAYDACALVIPEYEGETPEESENDDSGAVMEPDDVEVEDVDEEVQGGINAELGELPHLRLRHDLVPAEISPARFFAVIITKVLNNSSVTQHERARALRRTARS